MSIGKTFRFLLQFTWVNLGALIAFAAVILGGCYATGVPDASAHSRLFGSYYAMFPAIILMCLFFYAFALCTTHLNLGLSMGARRLDYFLALQGIFLFYTAVCWVLEWFMAMFPLLANWSVWDKNLPVTYSRSPLDFPLLCAAALVLGTLSGLLMVRSKVLGTLVITLSLMVVLCVTVFQLLSAETGLFDGLQQTEWAWLAGLPRLLVAGLAAASVAGEFLIWRTIQRACVR